METWAWLTAYIVGFVLLQVYLYLYFTNRTSTSESGGARAESGRSAAGIPGIPVDSDDGQTRAERGVRESDVDHTSDLGPPGDLSIDEVVRCDECGAYNSRDQMFRYCRNCSEKL